MISKPEMVNLQSRPRPTSLLQDAQFRELAKLYVADSSQCELKLIGKEAESTDVREVISKKETRDGTTTWSFSAKFPKVIITTEGKLLAKFELKEQSLWFQWAKKPEEAKVNLCALHAGNQGRRSG